MKRLINKIFSGVQVEALTHVYNLLIVAYILVFFPQISRSALLLAVHLAAAAAYAGFQIARNRSGGHFLQLCTVLVPIALLSVFHYETGLFNRLIFPDFLDGIAVAVDKALFGCMPCLFLREKMPYEWLAQFSHAAYASFYLLLIGPLTLLYFKEARGIGSVRSSREFWERAVRLQEMLFVLMFTMFVCYLIAVVVPVKGPTDHHAALFPRPAGMVAIMDFLFSNGDLDGGAVPSSHVAGALVVVIYSFRYLGPWAWAALGLFVPLTFSTVYNSYHYASDILTGLLAGWLFYAIGRAILRAVTSCCSSAAERPRAALRQAAGAPEEARGDNGAGRRNL